MILGAIVHWISLQESMKAPEFRLHSFHDLQGIFIPQQALTLLRVELSSQRHTQK